MNYFLVDSMRESYPEIVRTVVQEGVLTAPRGVGTKEIPAAVIDLCDPYDALATGTGRKLNVGLCVAEFLHLVAGEDDPALLIKIAPHYASFVDPETGKLRGSYGRRIKKQMQGAVDKLLKDPSTRQAHVTCWDPHYDALPGMHDYPCVTSAGWTVRHGALQAFVEMRSNDVWLGTPGDVFAWSQLQLTLAHILGVPAGRYTHYARSLHMYAKDEGKAEALRSDDTWDWEPTFMGLAASTWDEAVVRAKTLLAGVKPSGCTDGEAAMRDRVAKFL